MSFYIASLLFILMSCSHNRYRRQSPESLYTMGLKLREEYQGESEKIEEVNAISDELVGRNKGDYRGHLLKSWVVKRQGFLNEKEGYLTNQINKSFQHLQKASALNPLGLDVYADAISLLITVGNFDKAKATLFDYKVKLEAKQDSYHQYRYRYELANFYFKQKKVEEAINATYECEKFSKNIYRQKIVSI